MPKKILIIDDDPVVVKYLMAVFSDNGQVTCSASSSMEGLDVVKKEKPQRIKEGWEGLKTIISRIRKLVHDILFFAKERELKWDRVDVLNFVDDVAATVEPKIKAKGIEFVCSFDTALGEFEIDETKGIYEWEIGRQYPEEQEYPDGSGSE